MRVNFLLGRCQDDSSEKIFGLRDDIYRRPAYIDELRKNRKKWVAVVINKARYHVRFFAIDRCIMFPRVAGKKVKRCDGVLFYNSTVTFVELKERNVDRNWLAKGEQQLRSTINHFNASDAAENYPIRSAYIANRLQPGFNKGHLMRSENFFTETGYALRIQNTIVLE